MPEGATVHALQLLRVMDSILVADMGNAYVVVVVCDGVCPLVEPAGHVVELLDQLAKPWAELA